MIQQDTLNVKLSHSQLNKLKSGMRDSKEVSLVFLLNVIGNDKTNYPQKLLLTNTHVSKICKSFANGSSANIQFLKVNHLR